MFTNSVILMPEAITAFLCFIVLLIDLFIPKKKNLIPFLLFFGNLLVFLSLIFLVPYTNLSFQKIFINDNLAVFSKLILVIISQLVIILSLSWVKENLEKYYGEYFLLLIASQLGIMTVISSTEMILLYLALELIAIPSFALVALDKDNPKSAEASIKYFFLSVLCSALFLFGMIFYYGLTKTTTFTTIFSILNFSSPLAIFITLLLLLGFGFKVGLFPIHIWIPDVYQSAPVPVAAFLSLAPKIAGLVVFWRIFSVFLPLQDSNLFIFIVLVIATIFLGNLSAIGQKNLRRLLGYSSIAHMGYILLAMISGSESSKSAILFYIFTYLFAMIGIFTVITIISNHKNPMEEVEEYKGLMKKEPLLATMLTIYFLALASIPLTGGFFAKFYIFLSLFEKGYTMIVALALVNVLMAFYYYMSVIQVIFDSEGKEENYQKITIPTLLKFILYFCVIGIILTGIFPTIFYLSL